MLFRFAVSPLAVLEMPEFQVSAEMIRLHFNRFVERHDGLQISPLEHVCQRHPHMRLRIHRIQFGHSHVISNCRIIECQFPVKTRSGQPHGGNVGVSDLGLR